MSSVDESPTDNWLTPSLWRRRVARWAGAVAVGLVTIAFAWLADGAFGLFEVVHADSPSWSLLPILAVCLLARAISGLFCPTPLYRALANRLVKQLPAAAGDDSKAATPGILPVDLAHDAGHEAPAGEHDPHPRNNTESRP